jgi:hypothetical protein
LKSNCIGSERPTFGHCGSVCSYFPFQGRAEFSSIYVVTCLGFLFSLAWYFVNRGSGAWQRNWESHVDLLEDEIMGPLYKTTLNRHTYKFHHIAEPFSATNGGSDVART